MARVSSGFDLDMMLDLRCQIVAGAGSPPFEGCPEPRNEEPEELFDTIMVSKGTQMGGGYRECRVARVDDAQVQERPQRRMKGRRTGSQLLIGCSPITAGPQLGVVDDHVK